MLAPSGVWASTMASRRNQSCSTLGFGLGDGRVDDQTVLEGSWPGKLSIDRAQPAGTVVAAFELDQGAPVMGLGERVDGPLREMACSGQVDGDARDQLEGPDTVSALAAPSAAEQPSRTRVESAPGRQRRCGVRACSLGNSLITAPVMMPERAFGADEQLLEVVAGVVLAQAGEAIPDAAVGQHRLEAPGSARGCCRSAAPRCRRHWSRGCRRSGRTPRPPG